MINLTIGGEAGQGLVTLGQLLARSLVRAGYHICVTQSYMSRVRGGHNTFAIRISDKEAACPREDIDLLIALDRETFDLHGGQLKPGGIMIADQALAISDPRLQALPFAAIAEKRHENIIALGLAGACLELEQELLVEVVNDFFGHKKPEETAGNREVLQKARGRAHDFPRLSLKPTLAPASRLLVNGNEAIALGATSAGLGLCAFYPMTPATSICLNLVTFAEKCGDFIVEQVEDEIAAVNLAIGAAYAGARAMVATSGGGFALMEEGVSLAAMSETPLVIALAMRPGPATGLPTRTAQEDLNLVVYAGHGEFPRAVFAPTSVEECFHLTRKAFALAEKSQGPVFVLTDQFMADSYRSLAPFADADLAPLPDSGPSGGDQTTGQPGSYQRYALTGSGISPRKFPGGADLVIADSDAHDEDGHLTEDLAVAQDQADKRSRKNRLLLDNFVEPHFYGAENPEVLLLAWGSGAGAVIETINIMAGRGAAWAALVFPQVWPLPPEKIRPRLLAYDARVFAVEGNATGQFAGLLRLACGFTVDGKINRYDGLPLTAAFILNHPLLAEAADFYPDGEE